jgi:alpha-beta hydrolase superfamily lysophospholipase
MIDYMTRTASSCPNTKFAIGGHSQGGVVTVRAIPEMSLALRRKIVAVTTVGSPDCPFQVATKCRSYCNRGDLVCSLPLPQNWNSASPVG